MKYKGGGRTKITDILLNSSSSSSSKNSKNSKNSSNSSNSSNYNNEKVKNKIDRLLKSKKPETIIAKIKTISYIDKILISIDVLQHDDKIKDVMNKLKKRHSEVIIQEEITRYIEELKELKTKLKRLETKLEKLLANKLELMKTRATLEGVDDILANPLKDLKDLRLAVSDIKVYIEYQERIIKELKEQVCSRILTPKLVGPICWFMATFVAMFYSQRSRKLLLNTSSGWNIQDELFTLLNDVLNDKYLKTEKGDHKDYEKFSDNTFGNILTLLFKKNSKSFPYNPEFKVGFASEVYIGKLYNLLNIEYHMFDYVSSSTLAYSCYNMEYDILKYTYKKGEYVEQYTGDHMHIYTYKKDNSNPTILIIRVCNIDTFDFYHPDIGILKGNVIHDKTIREELTSMREDIKYNGKNYLLDSVILTNWNIPRRHAIAGITCKGIKYVYNGWMRTSMNPTMASQEFTRNIPCELMQHDWNVKEGNDFCLNTKDCSLDILKQRIPKESRFCFNFSDSDSDRLLIYVLKDK